jgi:hypothetical protein
MNEVADGRERGREGEGREDPSFLHSSLSMLNSCPLYCSWTLAPGSKPAILSANRPHSPF